MTAHEPSCTECTRAGEHKPLTSAKRSCCCQAQRFTSRQVEVLCAVAAGASTEDAALELHMSSHTLARHLADMLRLSESHSRTELVAKAYAAGILEADCWPPRGTGCYCLRVPTSDGLIDYP